MVTGLRQATVLVELPRADLAAPAVVQCEAYARSALGQVERTVAHGGAIEGEDLRGQANPMLH